MTLPVSLLGQFWLVDFLFSPVYIVFSCYMLTMPNAKTQDLKCSKIQIECKHDKLRKVSDFGAFYAQPIGHAYIPNSKIWNSSGAKHFIEETFNLFYACLTGFQTLWDADCLLTNILEFCSVKCGPCYFIRNLRPADSFWLM